MFGWFKRKMEEVDAPRRPDLLHRWVVDIDDVKGRSCYIVRRYSWNPVLEWCNDHITIRFDSEEEARAFIEKHAHLPAAFDIQKSYNGQ